MTPAEQIAAAVAALDDARRALEALIASPCGDADVVGILEGVLDDIDANIAALRCFAGECA